MAGVDTITKEILREAGEKAEQIIVQAQKDAEAIRAAARARAEKEEETARQAMEAERKMLESRSASAAQMNARQTRLAARQAAIDEVLQKAYERLAGQDDAAYFSMVKQILSANVRPSSGEICFGEKDLKRLPEDFAKEAAQIAREKGGSLTVSEKSLPIENGFILKYGGIEENCTLAALFSQKRDVLRDSVNEILW